MWSSFFWHSCTHHTPLDGCHPPLERQPVEDHPHHNLLKTAAALPQSSAFEDRPHGRDTPGRRGSRSTVSTGSRSAACSDSTSRRSGTPPSARERGRVTGVAEPTSESQPSGWGRPVPWASPTPGPHSVSDATAVAGQPGDRSPEAPSQGCPSPGTSLRNIRSVWPSLALGNRQIDTGPTDFVKDSAARAWGSGRPGGR